MDDELNNDKSKRQVFWSESVAVGDECFLQNIQKELSDRIPGCSIVSEKETTSLRESQSFYSTLLGRQIDPLSTKNSYLLHLND